jgi:chemotaxis protein methyltransferase CheR
MADGPRIDDVLDWVSAHTALRTDRHRGRDMGAQVRRAMARAAIEDPLRFIRHLEDEEEAAAALIDTLTVGETYFFRDRRHVEVVSRTLLPRLGEERRGAPLRLCSAGCATGEEAYTLAMLAEEAGLRGTSVLGVDLSPGAVARARLGRYGRWSLRGVEEARQRRFFRHDGDAFVVVDRIRQGVRFEVLNLRSETWPPMPAASFDVVVCRNVLVYLVPDAVSRVARHLAGSLAPGGWLLVAPTDPRLQCGDDLDPVRTPAGVAYRRPLRSASGPPGPSLPGNPGPFPPLGEKQSTVHSLSGATRRSPSAARLGYATERESGDAEVAAPDLGVERSTRSAVACQQAAALADAGRTGEAAAALAAALARDPCHAPLHAIRALALLELGRPEDARSSARSALFLDPGLVVAHLALAAAEQTLGHADAAGRAGRAARRLLEAPEGTTIALGANAPPGRLLSLAAAYAGVVRGAEGYPRPPRR